MSRRAKAHAEHNSSERWLITYADLVTLLFALFIVLFANSNLDEGKFGKTADSFSRAFDIGIGVLGGQGTTATSIFGEGTGGLNTGLGGSSESDFQVLSDEVTQLTLARGIYDQVQVRTADGQVVVSLSNNLLFAPASAEISESALPFLADLADLLNRMPNEARVEGHTDNIPVNVGAFPSNWELSAARATAVTRFFIEQGGVDPLRLSAVGFAEFRPIADNGTAAGRAQNRRADLVILYPQDQTAAGADTPPAGEE